MQEDIVGQMVGTEEFRREVEASAKPLNQTVRHERLVRGWRGHITSDAVPGPVRGGWSWGNWAMQESKRDRVRVSGGDFSLNVMGKGGADTVVVCCADVSGTAPASIHLAQERLDELAIFH